MTKKVTSRDDAAAVGSQLPVAVRTEILALVAATVRGPAAPVSNTTSWTVNAGLYDYAENTGLTGAVTINNPSSPPAAGETLWLSLTGTASRAITHGSEFEASGAVALPTTTSGTARLDIGYVRTAASKWRVVAVV